MKWTVLLFIVFFNSCITTSKEDFRTELLVNCVQNENGEARFTSNNPSYSEIIVKDHLHKYKVGHQYVLILRKN